MVNKNLKKFFEEKRKDFPILDVKVNCKKLVYVDNGATTQKPIQVINSISNYYKNYNSNIHRGIHSLSELATKEYENVRKKVSNFINCDEKEVVFTKGTTEGLNLVAFGFVHKLKKGDEIVLSYSEHHANLVPWQEVAKKTGAVLKFISYDDDFRLNLDEAEKLISKKTKIVSIAHVSNVLGTINPISDLVKLARKVGAIIVVDGAQSVPHMKIDVKKLDVDFLSFSSHKMCGPTGVGVLYGKKSLLEELNPISFGGDMIYEVNFCSSTYNEVPYRFEAGTPNIEGVIGFGCAIDYLQEIGMDNIQKYEESLCEYFLEKVKGVSNFKIYGPKNCENRAAVFSFNISGIHPHDISTILDKEGIAIRGGHHCAMPLMGILDTSATSRISLYFYNTFEEIDYIVSILKKVKSIYDKGNFLLD